MPHYRDDLDAARARIDTLEAKLRERDAALEARDAELAELRAKLVRERGGAAEDAADAADPRRGQRALLVALAACGFATATGYAMVRPSYCHGPRRASPADLLHAPATPAMARAVPHTQVDLPDVAFDRNAASRALSESARLAADCAEPSGPAGPGRVVVTFDPSGDVRAAEVVSGRFTGTAVGACVEDTFHFRTAPVPAFDGAPVTISKSFRVE